jgi:ligand-binding sensor domain-containing protein/putative methionine-R-sulfoxide reductase with GAF domain
LGNLQKLNNLLHLLKSLLTLSMRCVTAFIFFCLCLNVSAQRYNNYIFRHLNQPDGLLHTSVRSVVQDTTGYVWILTLNGFQRYDGTRFVNYPFDLNKVNRGRDIRDVSLFADSSNNCLWIIGAEIEKFDLTKNTSVLYNTGMIMSDSSFKFDRYTDSSGSVWLAGPFGFMSYNSTLKKMFPYYFTATTLSQGRGLTFTDKEKGEIWIADWTGLSLFDAKTKKKYTHNYNPLHHPLLQLMNKNNLTALIKDSEQNIWIGSNTQDFYRYNCIDKKLSVYSLAKIENLAPRKNAEDHLRMVTCFFEDNHQNVWIGTVNGGLLKYNRGSDSFDYTLNEDRDKQGLQYNYEITCIFQDRQDNIWLGTDKGISIFNPYQQSFKTIHHEENNPASLPQNEINHFIQATNGDIICGTWGGGITVYDSSWQFKKNIRTPGPYEYNLVWDFIQNDDGNIWAGCQHGYIHIYDAVKGIIKTIHPPELHNYTIWDMKKDSAGNIWFALHDGKIAQWNKQQQKFYAYNDTEKGIEQVFTSAINIFFDSRQRCWVSTVYGFKQFDTKRMMYSAVYLPDKKNPFSVSAYNCTGIEEYNDSTLLIGTAYGGLNFFNINTKKFTHTTVSNGLPANTIHSIKKDSTGFFWFTTDFDLYKFKPGTGKFIRYNIEPGTINTEFKNTSFYTLQDGRWLTATAAEIICFNPVIDPASKNNAEKPQITGFKIFDTPLQADSLLSSGKPVRLSYKQNFLTVEFALLNFSGMQQTDYFYRLQGVDKDWVNAGAKRFASYTNLEPGEYIFYVKTSIEDQPGREISFKIIIAPPFWKTWWFILLVSAFMLVLVYQFIKWREKNIRGIQEQKLKVQELNAAQYKSKLEMEQIVNYFSYSLIDKTTVDAVLWDVAKNLIGRLGFEDCMIYLWNSDGTKMIQRAGYGPKGSIEEIEKNVFTVSPGQGVVGYVMQTRESVLIPDTSADPRYRVDELERLSEITVPIIYDDDLIGVIDSEHQQKNFFTRQHVQVLSTIATLMANKIRSIQSEQSLQQAKIEMLGINEKLIAAKLEALRSQMNPHFIFNCLNSIDNLIQNNEKEKATLYLSKFAKLIRSVLETSKNNTVSCWKDMETLKLYLQLEELRWDKKFQYQVIVADEIVNGDYKVPPLIIQPFVENAIHHGLLNKIEGDKKLLIKVQVVNNHIHYLIEDNGVGRAKANEYRQLNKPSHQSMGMQITTDRINLFNKNNNGFVKITDLVDEQQQPCGTKVAIELINQS